MGREDFYISNYEAALSVVATSMKKARLSIVVLIVNSFIGGLVFSVGGMLSDTIQGLSPDINASNPGIMKMLSGLFYPIGLFYVVILGVDLFNSNILYFSVGLFRRGVSIFDCLVSWVISYIFNLVGTIFVCYVICHFSFMSLEEQFKAASYDVLLEKCSFSFVQNLIKGMAGNFFVCLAVYLLLMAKPLHVRFFLLFLPIFTFVSLNFSHAVADFYVLIIGLINSGPLLIGKAIWKVMVPVALGNIIGGMFFSFMIPFYLHLYVVESDQDKLNLPEYDLRDEQPNLINDSRVVKGKFPQYEDEDRENQDSLKASDEPSISNHDFTSSDSIRLNEGATVPQPFYGSQNNLSRRASRQSVLTRYTTASSRYSRKSPRKVFPIYGMNPPTKREASIASNRKAVRISEDKPDNIPEDFDETRSAEFVTDKIKSMLSRRPSSVKRGDIESRNSLPNIALGARRSGASISSPSDPNLATDLNLKRCVTLPPPLHNKLCRN